jgi:single-strand DNA-binding protein
MSSLNKVSLLGSLGADPEIKSFQNGGRVCNLRLATSERWKDKSTGEQKETTEWHSVSIFSDGLVGVAERYLTKGSKVYIEGQLKTRKWQDASGNDKYSTEIVLNGPKAAMILLGSKGEAKPDGGSSDPSNMHGGSHTTWDNDLDDDLPPF